MSYQVYKFIHVLSVIFLFVAIGGFAIHGANGGTKETNGARKMLAIVHGVALFLIFGAGMGLMARLGIKHGGGWPVWLYIKTAVWLLLGASMVLLNRKPAMGKVWFFVLPLVGAIAAYSAVFKPFA